jgi:hypothetical protein
MGTDDAARSRVTRRVFTQLAALVLTLFLSPTKIAGAQSSEALSCGATASVVRQSTDSARPPSGSAVSDSATDAAIILYAAASAREITFARQPNIRVRLCGGLDSARIVERRNLPTPVVVGRVYRDVYIAVEVFGRLNAECVRALLTPTPVDSTGQRNACASLDIGGAGRRPPGG